MYLRIPVYAIRNDIIADMSMSRSKGSYSGAKGK